VIVDEVPAPTPGPGEAVIRVHAGAVNFPDVLVIANQYQVKADVPFTVGSEMAGTVLEVADDVAADPAGLRPGDHVAGVMFIGAFADEIAVPVSSLSRMDPALDLSNLAAFGVAHATAYHALRSIARVEPGKWVAVSGAGGGVGLAAVELATVLGAKVVAAAATEAKLDACRQKGAVVLVNYSTDDVRASLRKLPTGGADVVIDPVGGPLAEQFLRGLRWGGRFVSVGFASGDIPRIPLNLVLLKGLAVLGFEYTGFTTNRPDEARRNTDELFALLRESRVAPHVSARYPVADAAAALALVADRQAIGKVLIEFN
jgi:NADPH2:quinone reductase